MHKLSLTCTLGLIALASAPALAQMTYVSQFRQVSASRPGFTPQSFTAPNFGPFNASANSGGAFANQQSTLTASAMNWTGSAGPAGGSPPGSGISDFDVTFDVAVRSLFTWTSTLSGASAPQSRLTGGPDNLDIFATWDGAPRSGILRPGRYRLAVLSCCFTAGTVNFTLAERPFTIDWSSIDGGGAINTAGGSFRLSGTIGQADASRTFTSGSFGLRGGFWAPFEVCAADYNLDGLVDFFDYLDFVSDFDASFPRADFNDDGLVDFFDYLDFVAAYDLGCS